MGQNLENKRRRGYWLILLCGLLLLIWRARYGFCFNDEPFCVTLAQRMFQGDALIGDEWHGVQNFGPVLLPLYALFRLFSPTNEGILLFLRYAYCLLWWGVCAGVFWTLEKQFRGAVLAFLYLILFSPLDYMTVSYTSVGLMAALLLCCVISQTATEQQRLSWGRVLAFSMLWIVLTLCLPFMAAAYVLVLLISGVGGWIEKQKRRDRFFFRNLFRLSGLSVLPVAAAAAVYLLIFVLSRTVLSRVMESIPYILSDPEHGSVSVVGTLIDLPYYIYTQFPAFMAVSALVFACGLIMDCRRFRLGLFGICAALFAYG